MGYLRKEPDSSLLYTVVNQLDPDAEGLLHVKHLLKPCVNTIFNLQEYNNRISDEEDNCSYLFRRRRDS